MEKSFPRLSGLPLFPALFGFALLFLPAGPAPAAETVPAAVQASFEKFGASWMARLAQINRDNSQNPKAETLAPGRVIGRYLCYGPDCTREVRATGSQATPFVGILRYSQKTMEKEGETAQKMKAHSGVAAAEIQVMEIFRYTGGRWVY